MNFYKKTVFWVGMVTILVLPVFAYAQEQDDDVSKAMTKFNEERGKFDKSKSLRESNKENNQTEDVDLVQGTKNLLEKSLDVLEAQNKQLERNVKVKTNEYGDFANDILKNVKENGSKLDEFRDLIISSSSTQNLVGIAGQISDYRNAHRDDIRKLVIFAHLNQFEKTVVRTAQNRNTILSKKIKELKSKGEDVTVLEKLTSDSQSKIDQVETKLSDVSKEVGLASGGLDLTNIEKELGDISSLVKEIYQIFKQIAIKGNEIFSNSNH